MRMHIFVAFFAFIVANGCINRAVELSPADYGAIDELRDSVTNAIVAGDAAAYAELCTEDVRLLHAGSPIITGKAELEAHNAAMFGAVAVTSLVLTPVEIYGTGDVAYEVGTQELTIEPTVPEFAGSRKYVHVFRRGGDGEWRFAALMSNNN
jgi:FMN-dependent NADH-azoreductase